MLCDFYKKHDGDTIWWIRDLDKVASTYFTFDKKNYYNLLDYPEGLSKEQKELFDKENPEYVKYLNEHF